MAPDYTGSASTIRSKANWHGQVWAGSIPQTVVLTGTVSATPTFPVTTVAYTVSTGTYTNVKADQRIVFYTSGGVRKGETRVRFKATVTNVAMPIAETSANTIDIASGDTFTVYEVWNIQDRLVSATVDFDKDTLIAVGSYGNDPPPVANAGGLWFGFLDSGQTYATVTFDASTSFVVDPDSSTFTVVWAVVDGTITVGTTTTNAITVRFPAGFRHVTLTVTDSGSGVSTTRYVPVRVYDPAGTLPMRVTSLSLNSATKDGWSAEIEMARESAHDLTTLPDGSLIVVFEQAYYGSTQASYRSAVANRSHILAALFLESETIDFQPGSGAVTFRAEGPLAVLKRTPALPQLMISGSGGTLWSHLKTLTINRALWYLAFWHSTVMDYFDFVWVPTAYDEHYPRIAIENIDSIAGQLADLTESIVADPTCDALGRILILPRPSQLSTAQRAALTTTWAFTTADIVDISMDRVHHGSVKHVRGEGITQGSVPVFSNAGNAPSPIGVGSETLGRQIILTQAELNTRTGKHFAYVNGLYNGVFVPQGVRVTVPDGYAIFDPAYREWVTLTLTSTTNDRGVSFTTATRWTVDAVSISYDADTGGRDLELTISHETDGPDGVSYTPPANTDDNLINQPGVDLNVPGLGDYTPVSSPLSSGTGTVATFWDDNYLRITTAWSAALPPYTSTLLSGLTNWPGGTLLDFTVRAASPLYLGTGTRVDGWLLTSVGVTMITNIFDVAFELDGITPVAPRALSSPHTLPSLGVAGNRSMQFERGVDNWGIVVSYIYGTGTRASYTTDGTTWTDVTVNNFWDTNNGSTWLPGIWIDPHTAGHAITSAFTNTTTGATSTSDGYETFDYGATWAAISNPNITPGNGLSFEIAISFASSSKPAYFNKWTYVSPGVATVKLLRADGSGAPVDISPFDGTYYYGGNGHRSIVASDDDPDTLLDFGVVDTAGTGSIVALTRNARASVPTWTEVVAHSASLPWRSGYMAGTNTFYLLGAAVLGFSADGGVTLLDKTGDILTAAVAIGLCGG